VPIKKTDLGPHGEHLLADEDGMVAAEGDTPEALNWGTRHHPGHSEDPAPEEGGHPTRYQSWEHYHAMCVTAGTRADNARKLAGEPDEASSAGG
jgi:hypothetical protein